MKEESAPLKPVPGTPAELTREIKALLDELRALLVTLSGETLLKIPADPERLAPFGRGVASAIGSLAMFNEALLRRLLSSGQALPAVQGPPWASEVFEWARLPDRQPRRRVVEQRLDGLLDRVNRRIGYLDEETMMSVPDDPGELTEFLSLSIVVQHHLSWYLDTACLPRMARAMKGMGTRAEP